MAPRGIPQVEVTFDIDANGILSVSAKDKGTGKEQKIKIESSTGLSDADIQKMRDEAEQNREEDTKKEEKIKLINEADSYVFTTEKQMTELGDKISEDEKVNLEKLIGELNEAKNTENLELITSKKSELEGVWNQITTRLYQTDSTGDDGKSDDGTQDVDYEEVK